MTERAIVIGSNSFSGASFIQYALKQGRPAGVAERGERQGLERST